MDKDDFIKKYEKAIESQETTQSHKKITYDYREILKSEKLWDFVKKSKEHINIPEDGLEEGTSILDYQDGEERLAALIHDISEFIASTKLYYSEWPNLPGFILNLILYNKEDIESLKGKNSLILTNDLSADCSGLFDGEIVNQINKLNLKELNRSHPVVIRLSPYTTETQLRDYITNCFEFVIEPLLDKYKKPDSMVGTNKKSPKLQTEEINQFIIKNAKIPRKELRELIREKFGKDYLTHELNSRLARLRKKSRQQL